MKLLYVCHRYFPYIGGIESHVRNIGERLAVDNDVSVATTDPSGKLPKFELINNVKIYRFNSWAPNDAYFFSRGLKKFLHSKSNNFDIVHAHGYQAFPALYAALAKNNNQFVFSSHYHGTGHTPFRSLLLKPYKLIGRRTFDLADKIICVSEYEKQLVMADFNINDHKIVKIPNGIDSSEFLGIEKSQTAYKQILSVGRLEKYKGIHYLIAGLSRLDSNFMLNIVGDGPYEGALKNLVEKFHLENRVRFYKNLARKDLVQMYVDADLFVLLSNHESYGLAVAEALAAGTPCFVANVSALAEWIDNQNCFGVKYPIDVIEVNSLIKKIIGKKIKPKKLLDWSEVVQEHRNLYACLT